MYCTTKISEFISKNRLPISMVDWFSKLEAPSTTVRSGITVQKWIVFIDLVKMQVWLVVGFALFYSSFVFCDCNCKLKLNVVGLTNEHISNLFNLTSPYLAVLRIFHLQILGDMVLMVHAKNKTVQKKKNIYFGL